MEAVQITELLEISSQLGPSVETMAELFNSWKGFWNTPLRRQCSSRSVFAAAL